MYRKILKRLAEPTAAAEDATRRRILDAALREATATGAHRLTMEAVARRAGLNRTTIYRRFGNMEKVVSALAMREGRAMTAALREATAGIEDPRALFTEGFVAAHRFAREHPLIARTAEFEPGKLVEAGLANDAALLTLGGEFMAEAIRWAQAKGELSHLDPRSAGDTLARLFASFVLMPGKLNDLGSDDAARRYADTTLIPMLFGPPAAPPES